MRQLAPSWISFCCLRPVIVSVYFVFFLSFFTQIILRVINMNVYIYTILFFLTYTAFIYNYTQWCSQGGMAHPIDIKYINFLCALIHFVYFKNYFVIFLYNYFVFMYKYTQISLSFSSMGSVLYLIFTDKTHKTICTDV